MSVSKWAYSPEKCDGDYCCGECDLCPKKDEGDEECEECDLFGHNGFIDYCALCESHSNFTPIEK